MTWEWLLGIATGPFGYFVLRRAPYLACYGYGRILAAQQRLTLDRNATVELGRSEILASFADSALAAWRAADWPKVWAGLMYWRHELHEFAADTWRGAKRDVRLVWLWLNRQPTAKPDLPRTETDQRIEHLSQCMPLVGSDHPGAEIAEVAAGGALFDMEQRRVTLLRDLRDPDKPSGIKEIREWLRAKAILTKHYDENPADAALNAQQRGMAVRQSLFAVPTGLSLTPWLLAGLVGMGGVIVTDQWRIGRLHHEVGALKDWQREAKKANTQWAEYGAKVTARLETTAMKCVAEIDNANNKALAAEVAAAKERRRRLNEKAASLAGGAAVPLSDILRELPGAGDSGSAGDPANSNP